MMAATLHIDPSSSAACEAATSRPSSCSASSLHCRIYPVRLRLGWMKRATVMMQRTPGILQCITGMPASLLASLQLRSFPVLVQPCCWACGMADVLTVMPCDEQRGSTKRFWENFDGCRKGVI